MTFKNEYVPPLDQETSEFFRNARETLRTGFSKFDKWTVDRGRDMVLYRRAGGGPEHPKADYWSFINAEGEHQFQTDQLEKSSVSPDEIAITLSLARHGDGARFTDELLFSIKEALSENKRWHLFDPEAFKQCRLKLILRSTGQEI
jgi:hypothetical protein